MSRKTRRDRDSDARPAGRCSSLIEGNHVGKGRYLATETELEVSRGALPSLPLTETQAQPSCCCGDPCDPSGV